jgi:hypothetical protein
LKTRQLRAGKEINRGWTEIVRIKERQKVKVKAGVTIGAISFFAFILLILSILFESAVSINASLDFVRNFELSALILMREEGFLMSVRRGIILHCCLLMALTGCQTKPASSEQSSATSQTNSSTVQVSSQTATTNSTTAPVAQNSSVGNANTTAATTTTPGRIDACSLITRAEIESAQDEQVIEARSTAVSHSRFAISQCYYVVAPAVKSVSLELTQRVAAQSGAASPREFWEERFERAGRERKGESERQGNAQRDADKGGASREEAEEEEGGAPPVKVTGVGDEAFWVGNRKVGALYVLKDDSIIRISIGGAEAGNIKIEKMKALAQLAIKRLGD